MHSKQLKHFKPLNPDRRREREREGKSERERCDEEGGAAAGPRESHFPSGRWQMPYVLSTALVLILGGSRQAHIRLCDLCTPPPNPPNHSLCFHRVCGSVTEELGPLDGSAKCSFPSNMVRRASRPHQLRLCCTRLYSGIVMVAGWESYQPAGNDQQRLKDRTSGFASYNAFPSKLTKVFDLSSLCLHHVRMDLQAESVMKTLPGETLPGWCWSTIQHLRVAT